MPVNGASVAHAAWAFPIAGILVGVIGAVVYALAYRAGLPAVAVGGTRRRGDDGGDRLPA